MELKTITLRAASRSEGRIGKLRVTVAFCPTSENAEENKDVVEGASTGLSSRSFNSMHSLYATGPDPYDKLKYRPGEARVTQCYRVFQC